MGALSPILPRVTPPMGKLGSAHDGEIEAVVGQLRRVLAGRGLTFNDLALALPPRTGVVWCDAPAEWQPETWGELARWLAERAGQTRPHERDFVRQWLRGLYARLWGGDD